MSFFSEFPQQSPPEPVAQPRPAWAEPDHVIPGSVPGDLLLIRTEDVAVAIGCIRACPNGFGFTAHVRTRGKAKSGEGGPGFNDPFDRLRRRGNAPGDALQLGLLYADGRRGATTGGLGSKGDMILTPGGSGGTDRRWDGNFWVYPLPPDGPVTLVASWAERGAPETRAELDGAAIRAAAARAVILWPEEPYMYPSGSPATRSMTFTSRKVDEPGSEADRQQH